MCGHENVVSDLRTASYFVILNIPLQLEVLFSKSDVRASLVTPKETPLRLQPGRLSDLYDGSVYRSFAESVADYPE